MKIYGERHPPTEERWYKLTPVYLGHSEVEIESVTERRRDYENWVYTLPYHHFIERPFPPGVWWRSYNELWAVAKFGVRDYEESGKKTIPIEVGKLYDGGPLRVVFADGYVFDMPSQTNVGFVRHTESF
ncbi:MAG: hypothetical protein Q8J76_14935 [Desulfobulbaceae bacterium]|nr:hypothetical protein [Desulfobulbaceae bacterium]